MKKNEKSSNQLSNKTKLTLYYIAAASGLLAAITTIYVDGFTTRAIIWLFFAMIYGIMLPASLKNKQK